MRSEAIKQIHIAIQETKKLIITDKNHILISFLSELERYKNLTTDHWPLTAKEKTTVDIGRVAVRELDDFYPHYVTLLSNIGAILREE